MIVHGSANDAAPAAQFQALSDAYHADLGTRARFSFLCDHGLGHGPAPRVMLAPERRMG